MPSSRAFLCGLFIIAASTNVIMAQSGDDVFDQRAGGFAGPGTPTMGDGTDYRGLNDASRPKPTVLIFSDSNGPAGTFDTVFLRLAIPRTLIGVDLYVRSDGGLEDGFRGVSDFRLRAGIGGQTVLVRDVNPRDDGTVNRYLFDRPVEVYDIAASFARSTSGGPRIIELDAILVPEPGGLALLTAAGLLALRRRRR